LEVFESEVDGNEFSLIKTDESGWKADIIRYQPTTSN